MRPPGTPCYCHHALPNPQDFLRAHGSTLGDGMVLVADTQSSGKGGWVGARGSLVTVQVACHTLPHCLQTHAPRMPSDPQWHTHHPDLAPALAPAGRGGNTWTSPAGCLMFSASRRLAVPSPASAPFINYVVGGWAHAPHASMEREGLVDS